MDRKAKPEIGNSERLGGFDSMVVDGGCGKKHLRDFSEGVLEDKRIRVSDVEVAAVFDNLAEAVGQPYPIQ